MTDAKDNAREAAELKELANNIRTYQQEGGISDAQLVRRYPQLGSERTFKKCHEGSFDDLDIEQWLVGYRTVWFTIESTQVAPKSADPVYDDLSTVLLLKRALLDIMREDGNARVLLIEADSGLGKTKALRSLHQRYGTRVLMVEVLELWADNPSALLKAILVAGGYDPDDVPAAACDRWDKVVALLSANRYALALDECHHAGPRILNTVKSLVNTTPGEVIISAMPTLWRKLETKAYEEVRQLTRNRLAERIHIAGLKKGDVARFLARRVPGITDNIVSFAMPLLLDRAVNHGNMAFIRDVCRRLVKLERNQALEEADVAAAISDEVESRKPKSLMPVRAA